MIHCNVTTPAFAGSCFKHNIQDYAGNLQQQNFNGRRSHNGDIAVAVDSIVVLTHFSEEESSLSDNNIEIEFEDKVDCLVWSPDSLILILGDSQGNIHFLSREGELLLSHSLLPTGVTSKVIEITIFENSDETIIFVCHDNGAMFAIRRVMFQKMYEIGKKSPDMLLAATKRLQIVPFQIPVSLKVPFTKFQLLFDEQPVAENTQPFKVISLNGDGELMIHYFTISFNQTFTAALTPEKITNVNDVYYNSRTGSARELSASGVDDDFYDVDFCNDFKTMVVHNYENEMLFAIFDNNTILFDIHFEKIHKIATNYEKFVKIESMASVFMENGEITSFIVSLKRFKSNFIRNFVYSFIEQKTDNYFGESPSKFAINEHYKPFRSKISVCEMGEINLNDIVQNNLSSTSNRVSYIREHEGQIPNNYFGVDFACDNNLLLFAQQHGKKGTSSLFMTGLQYSFLSLRWMMFHILGLKIGMNMNEDLLNEALHNQNSSGLFSGVVLHFILAIGSLENTLIRNSVNFQTCFQQMVSTAEQLLTGLFQSLRRLNDFIDIRAGLQLMLQVPCPPKHSLEKILQLTQSLLESLIISGSNSQAESSLNHIHFCKQLLITAETILAQSGDHGLIVENNQNNNNNNANVINDSMETEELGASTTTNTPSASTPSLASAQVIKSIDDLIREKSDEHLRRVFFALNPIKIHRFYFHQLRQRKLDVCELLFRRNQSEILENLFETNSSDDIANIQRKLKDYFPISRDVAAVKVWVFQQFMIILNRFPIRSDFIDSLKRMCLQTTSFALDCEKCDSHPFSGIVFIDFAIEVLNQFLTFDEKNVKFSTEFFVDILERGYVHTNKTSRKHLQLSDENSQVSGDSDHDNEDDEIDNEEEEEYYDNDDEFGEEHVKRLSLAQKVDIFIDKYVNSQMDIYHRNISFPVIQLMIVIHFVFHVQFESMTSLHEKIRFEDLFEIGLKRFLFDKLSTMDESKLKSFIENDLQAFVSSLQLKFSLDYSSNSFVSRFISNYLFDFVSDNLSHKIILNESDFTLFKAGILESSKNYENIIFMFDSNTHEEIVDDTTVMALSRLTEVIVQISDLLQKSKCILHAFQLPATNFITEINTSQSFDTLMLLATQCFQALPSNTSLKDSLHEMISMKRLKILTFHYGILDFDARNLTQLRKCAMKIVMHVRDDFQALSDALKLVELTSNCLQDVKSVLVRALVIRCLQFDGPKSNNSANNNNNTSLLTSTAALSSIAASSSVAATNRIQCIAAILQVIKDYSLLDSAIDDAVNILLAQIENEIFQYYDLKNFDKSFEKVHNGDTENDEIDVKEYIIFKMNDKNDDEYDREHRKKFLNEIEMLLNSVIFIMQFYFDETNAKEVSFQHGQNQYISYLSSNNTSFSNLKYENLLTMKRLRTLLVDFNIVISFNAIHYNDMCKSILFSFSKDIYENCQNKFSDSFETNNFLNELSFASIRKLCKLLNLSIFNFIYYLINESIQRKNYVLTVFLADSLFVSHNQDVFSDDLTLLQNQAQVSLIWDISTLLGSLPAQSIFNMSHGGSSMQNTKLIFGSNNTGNITGTIFSGQNSIFGASNSDSIFDSNNNSNNSGNNSNVTSNNSNNNTSTNSSNALQNMMNNSNNNNSNNNNGYANSILSPKTMSSVGRLAFSSSKRLLQTLTLLTGGSAVSHTMHLLGGAQLFLSIEQRTTEAIQADLDVHGDRTLFIKKSKAPSSLPVFANEGFGLRSLTAKSSSGNSVAALCQPAFTWQDVFFSKDGMLLTEKDLMTPLMKYLSQETKRRSQLTCMQRFHNITNSFSASSNATAMSDVLELIHLLQRTENHLFAIRLMFESWSDPGPKKKLLYESLVTLSRKLLSYRDIDVSLGVAMLSLLDSTRIQCGESAYSVQSIQLNNNNMNTVNSPIKSVNHVFGVSSGISSLTASSPSAIQQLVGPLDALSEAVQLASGDLSRIERLCLLGEEVSRLFGNEFEVTRFQNMQTQAKWSRILLRQGVVVDFNMLGSTDNAVNGTGNANSNLLSGNSSNAMNSINGNVTTFTQHLIYEVLEKTQFDMDLTSEFCRQFNIDSEVLFLCAMEKVFLSQANQNWIVIFRQISHRLNEKTVVNCFKKILCKLNGLDYEKIDFICRFLIHSINDEYFDDNTDNLNNSFSKLSANNNNNSSKCNNNNNVVNVEIMEELKTYQRYSNLVNYLSSLQLTLPTVAGIATSTAKDPLTQYQSALKEVTRGAAPKVQFNERLPLWDLLEDPWGVIDPLFSVAHDAAAKLLPLCDLLNISVNDFQSRYVMSWYNREREVMLSAIRHEKEIDLKDLSQEIPNNIQSNNFIVFVKAVKDEISQIPEIIHRIEVWKWIYEKERNEKRIVAEMAIENALDLIFHVTNNKNKGFDSDNDNDDIDNEVDDVRGMDQDQSMMDNSLMMNESLELEFNEFSSMKNELLSELVKLRCEKSLLKYKEMLKQSFMRDSDFHYINFQIFQFDNNNNGGNSGNSVSASGTSGSGNNLIGNSNNSNINNFSNCFQPSVISQPLKVIQLLFEYMIEDSWNLQLHETLRFQTTFSILDFLFQSSLHISVKSYLSITGQIIREIASHGILLSPLYKHTSTDSNSPLNSPENLANNKDLILQIQSEVEFIRHNLVMKMLREESPENLPENNTASGAMTSSMPVNGANNSNGNNVAMSLSSSVFMGGNSSTATSSTNNQVVNTSTVGNNTMGSSSVGSTALENRRREDIHAGLSVASLLTFLQPEVRERYLQQLVTMVESSSSAITSTPTATGITNSNSSSSESNNTSEAPLFLRQASVRCQLRAAIGLHLLNYQQTHGTSKNSPYTPLRSLLVISELHQSRLSCHENSLLSVMGVRGEQNTVFGLRVDMAQVTAFVKTLLVDEKYQVEVMDLLRDVLLLVRGQLGTIRDKDAEALLRLYEMLMQHMRATDMKRSLFQAILHIFHATDFFNAIFMHEKAFPFVEILFQTYFESIEKIKQFATFMASKIENKSATAAVGMSSSSEPSNLFKRSANNSNNANAFGNMNNSVLAVNDPLNSSFHNMNAINNMNFFNSNNSSNNVQNEVKSRLLSYPSNAITFIPKCYNQGLFGSDLIEDVITTCKQSVQILLKTSQFFIHRADMKSQLLRVLSDITEFSCNENIRVLIATRNKTVNNTNSTIENKRNNVENILLQLLFESQNSIIETLLKINDATILESIQKQVLQVYMRSLKIPKHLQYEIVQFQENFWHMVETICEVIDEKRCESMFSYMFSQDITRTSDDAALTALMEVAMKNWKVKKGCNRTVAFLLHFIAQRLSKQAENPQFYSYVSNSLINCNAEAKRYLRLSFPVFVSLLSPVEMNVLMQHQKLFA